MASFFLREEAIMAEYLTYDWRPERIVPETQTINTATDKTSLIKNFRKFIQQSDDYEFKDNLQQDDKTLLKFLYARKFDIEDSYNLLKNYHFYRQRNVEIFKNFDWNSYDIRKSLEYGLPGVLSSKDRKGRCVLILNANNWDCNCISLLSIYRSILFTLEFLINDIHNQARGFVIIVDWTEFTFKQTTHLKPTVLKLMIEGLQDCFPVRFKGIHFIGQPWYVEAALTVIKPFLKDKIKDRIYVHGNNLSTLHELVHKDILPTELGGEKPSYNPESWLERIKETAT